MTIGAALELSVLLVCIWGFIAVLLTGQFSIIVILACVAALVAGYIARNKGWIPSPLTANISAIMVFLVAASMFIITMNLLTATVHLFLFLQVTKYVTRQNITESRWCYIISLFNVIGASVITTAITFGIMLAIYIFLVMMSMRLFVIASELDRVGRLTPQNVNQTSPRFSLSGFPTALYKTPVPRGYIFGGAILTIMAILLSVGLFSTIPRLATQNLFQTYGPPQPDPAVSAFSEEVEFGAFTEIQLDNAIAMFVQPVDDERPMHIRMRGVALDTFNGKSWSRTGHEVTRTQTYNFNPVFTTREYENTYTYRVIQPPGVTNFLFGDSFPLEIRLPPSFMLQVDRLAQSVFLAEMPPKEFQYEVDSMHEELSKRKDPLELTELYRPASNLMFSRSQRREGYGNELDSETTEAAVRALFVQMRNRLPEDEETTEPWRIFADGDVSTSVPDTAQTSASSEFNEFSIRNRRRNWYGYYHRRTGREILHDYLQKCLALPEELSTGRVPDLAQQWTEDEETTFTKATAIERRLRTEYGYSLTPRAKGNYIDSFLFDVRAGHCEYFATSMAVLLRNIGIPARVVNGFYSSEWNTLSGNFTVRQKDAHSWVEAWMSDQYGWMTFDPTPAGGVSRRINRGALIESLSRFTDAVKMRWYRYVVDYSFSDQVIIVRRILEWRTRMMNAMNRITIFGIGADDAMPVTLGDFTGEVDWRPVAIAGVIILLLLLWQIIRWLSRRRHNKITSIRFYNDLLQLLRRNGISMAPGQTPMEFARHVSARNPAWAKLVDATSIYYKRRFRNVDEHLEPGEVAMITDLKKSLKAGLSRKNGKNDA